MFFRRKKLDYVLPAALLIGCAVAPPDSKPASDPGRHPIDQDVASIAVGEPSRLQAIVTLAPPKAASFAAQAIIHRWVEADIFQYDATLKYNADGQFRDFAQPVVVVVPRKGAAPKTKASFSNLKAGSIYKVVVQARGNVGGTAPDLILTTAAASAVFDFSAIQDVQDTREAKLTVVFDAVPFNGKATTIVEPPAEGVYTNPDKPETGTAL
jgi:hypothetical protein